MYQNGNYALNTSDLIKDGKELEEWSESDHEYWTPVQLCSLLLLMIWHSLNCIIVLQSHVHIQNPKTLLKLKALSCFITAIHILL